MCAGLLFHSRLDDGLSFYSPPCPLCRSSLSRSRLGDGLFYRHPLCSVLLSPEFPCGDMFHRSPLCPFCNYLLPPSFLCGELFSRGFLCGGLHPLPLLRCGLSYGACRCGDLFPRHLLCDDTSSRCLSRHTLPSRSLLSRPPLCGVLLGGRLLHGASVCGGVPRDSRVRFVGCADISRS